MVKKIAIKVCPKANCPVIASGGKRKVRCPKHGDLLVGRVYEKQNILTAVEDFARDIHKAFSGK